MCNSAISWGRVACKSNWVPVSCFLLLLSLHMHILVWIVIIKSKIRIKCHVLTARSTMVREAPGFCRYHLDLPHSPPIEITNLTQGVMVTGCSHTWSSSNKNQANKKTLIFNPNITHTKNSLLKDCSKLKWRISSFSPHFCSTPPCFL